MIKRTIAMLLAVLMVALMGAGCAPTDQPDDVSSQESQNDSSKATDTEDVPSGTKITLMTYAGSSPEYTLESTPNYEAIRSILLERFGIDLVLEAYPSEQLGQVVNTRLATSDIPDIINYEFSQQRLLDVYNKGLILKLNDLIESDGPNVKKMFEVGLDILKDDINFFLCDNRNCPDCEKWVFGGKADV